jgi:CcmD family protein
VDGLGFLGVAYVAVWLGIVAFLFAITRRQKALEKRLEELRRTIDRGEVK